MAFKRSLVAALALAMVCFQLVESERDQYENRQDKPHEVRPLSEATDSKLQVDVPRLASATEKETNTGVARLFGAGNSIADRKKRAFSRWNGQETQLAGYESFTRWKPPIYQLSRPYYIPIYGASGRVPIFFPPQTLNINPGTPADNPVPHRPFTGPGYLPPKDYLPPDATTTTSTVKPTVTVKFRFMDEDEEERPVWPDAQSAAAMTTQRPSSVVPTRATRPPGMPDFPPLVHDIRGSSVNKLSVAEAQTERPSAGRGPQVTPSPASSGPSNCVWAIVSCCSATSNEVPENCFEQRGCPGPFWGSKPCDSEYAKAAIEAALKYYNK